MRARWLGLALLLVSGCADETLGVSPFRILAEQPYLPIGLTRTPALDPALDGGDDDLLLVGSTNMDQQFNAGAITAYNLQALHDLVTCRAPTTPGAPPAIIERLSYTPEQAEATECTSGGTLDAVIGDRDPRTWIWRGNVATLAGGGPIEVVRIAGDDYVAVPTRFDQSLTLVRVRTDGTLPPEGLVGQYRPPTTSDAGVPYLSCRDPGEDWLGVTSCSRTYTLPLGIDDPYAVSAIPVSDGNDRLVIGHLAPDRTGELGGITILEPEELECRLNATPDGSGVQCPAPPEGTSCPQQREDVIAKGQPPIFVGVRELDSVAFFASTPRLIGTNRFNQQPGLFIASNRRIDGRLNVVGVSFDELDASICQRFFEDIVAAQVRQLNNVPSADPEIELDLGEVTFGVTHRGIAYEPPAAEDEGRLWVTVRIQEQIDSDTSAIVTLAHDPQPASGQPGLRVLSTFSLGEEIATLELSPFAPPGRRWMIALDARGDQIFLLDVTDRTPVVLSRIEGRMIDPDDGRLRFTLASPLEVVFDRRDGLRRMYVTNFENSTIAVLDLTSDDPLEHRIIARVGIDRNTADRREGDDGFFRDQR